MKHKVLAVAVCGLLLVPAACHAQEEKVYTAEEILSVLEYSVPDCITLNDYKNMTVNMSEALEVSEEEVEDLLKAFASMYPTVYTETDREEVQDGDRVNIDYTGYLDGEAFDGGSAEGYDLVIGSGSFIDGFESGLIGAKNGETAELALIFPEDYPAENLKGQEVLFEVRVNAIETPETITYENITDEWARQNFASQGCEDLETLRAYLKEYLENAGKADYDNLLQDTIIMQMVEKSEIEIPEGYLDKRCELYKETVYDTVEKSGKSFEERMGGTEEEFLENLPVDMERRIKKDLVLQALVLDCDITVTQSEYDDYIQTYLRTYGFTEPEQLYEQLGVLSELDGEAYALLGYAEHQAWYKIKKEIHVVTGEED